MNITKIPIDKIVPNPWNPNEMPIDVLEHLLREYDRAGYLQPILVREIKEIDYDVDEAFGEIDPAVLEEHAEELERISSALDPKYQIIDGFHRWLGGWLYGYEEIEAVIVEMDDTAAKMTSINMNRIEGYTDPIRMAELLDDLETTVGLDDLSDYINMSKSEIEEHELLLDMPEIGEFDLDDTDEDIDEDPMIVVEFETTPAELERIEDVVGEGGEVGQRVKRYILNRHDQTEVK